MPLLSVKIDAFAVLRQSRGTSEPDPVQAAVLAELAGASSITAELNEKRIPVQDRDVYLLKRVVTGRFNLEIAPSTDLTALAVDLVPSRITFVPEQGDGHVPESGLDIRSREKDVAKRIETLTDNGIPAGILIDPDIQQFRSALRAGATHIQLLTTYYANSTGQARADELARLRDVADVARRHGVTVLGGSRLSYSSVADLGALEARDEELIQEVVLGHALAARAALVGIDTAVRDMLALL